MKPFVLLPVLLLSLALIVAAQNKSIYTSTKTSACRTIKATDEGTGSYIGECAGIGGFKVQLLEGDIRQTLNIITPARKKFELNFWSLFSSFSAIGEKIEWRTMAGIPVAMIARYNVADPEDSQKTRSYLMVSKIGKSAACVTDVVMPGPRQNKEARKLADSAASKPCKAVE